MDQEGGHCILESEDDLYKAPDAHDSELEDEEDSLTLHSEHTVDDSRPMIKALITTAENASKGMKVVDADDMCFSLAATSFEEFLVRIYFTHWILRFTGLNIRNATCEMPAPLKEHLIRIFTEQGRHLD
jgi:hypothetical protein